MLESPIQQMIQEILDYRCPRYEQLPDITLYSDQIIDALDRYTTPLLTDGSEHVITPTMINNYVKQRLIPAPEKKRYGREHLAHLYCICLLKQVFSISEIAALLEVQKHSYPFPAAYNYFCTELECSLRASFSTREFSPSYASHITPESELVRTAALSIACKLFTSRFLKFYLPEK